MERRYHMSDKNRQFFVEAEHTEDGYNRLVVFRKVSKGAWKHARILSVLQAYPSKVPLNIAVKWILADIT